MILIGSRGCGYKLGVSWLGLRLTDHLPESEVLSTILDTAKGVSTRQRWGEGMQLSYILYTGEMLAVTNLNQNLTRYDIDYGNLCLIRLKRRHTVSLRDLNLVTASISPSIQDVLELHALSPPLAG